MVLLIMDLVITALLTMDLVIMALLVIMVLLVIMDLLTMVLLITMALLTIRALPLRSQFTPAVVVAGAEPRDAVAANTAGTAPRWLKPQLTAPSTTQPRWRSRSASVKTKVEL
jgi:hypothetical protein